MIFKRRLKAINFGTCTGKITDFVYPQLRSNPFFWPNIKRLKGEFEDYYRYRIVNFRLFILSIKIV